MEKSYNPFKMWGSWAGAAIPWLYLLLVSIITATKFNQPFRYFYPTTEFAAIGWFILFCLTILGFLIGWGIHSLIKRLR